MGHEKPFKEALGALGWSQKELARRLGVTEETVSRWMNGKLPMPAYLKAYLSLAIRVKEFTAIL